MSSSNEPSTTTPPHSDESKSIAPSPQPTGDTLSSSSSDLTPSPPTLTQTTLVNPELQFRQKMHDLKADMTDNIDVIYLGNANLRNKTNLVWERIGRDNCLITQDALDKNSSAHKAYLTSLDPESAPPSAQLEDQPVLHTELAELSAVVKITTDDFWMASCGMWKGPTDLTPKINDLKLTCTGTVPDEPAFSTDYQSVLSNISWLLKKAETNGAKTSRGVLIPRGNAFKIKFRHILFEAKGPNDNDDDEELGEEFQLRNWPAFYSEGKSALRDLAAQDTHTVIPIPAYDIAGNLIKPADYRTALQEATIRIHFNLKHWYFSKENTDTFVADVTYLRVIIPPKITASPRKRTALAKDTYGSPSKKNRSFS